MARCGAFCCRLAEYYDATHFVREATTLFRPQKVARKSARQMMKKQKTVNTLDVLLRRYQYAPFLS